MANNLTAVQKSWNYCRCEKQTRSPKSLKRAGHRKATDSFSKPGCSINKQTFFRKMLLIAVEPALHFAGEATLPGAAPEPSLTWEEAPLGLSLICWWLKVQPLRIWRYMKQQMDTNGGWPKNQWHRYDMYLRIMIWYSTRNDDTTVFTCIYMYLSRQFSIDIIDVLSGSETPETQDQNPTWNGTRPSCRNASGGKGFSQPGRQPQWEPHPLLALYRSLQPQHMRYQRCIALFFMGLYKLKKKEIP